jgi:hypothetical protein
LSLSISAVCFPFIAFLYIYTFPSDARQHRRSELRPWRNVVEWRPPLVGAPAAQGALGPQKLENMTKIEYLMENSKNTVDLVAFRPKKQL